jgi:predicted outer membrane repeat protein
LVDSLMAEFSDADGQALDQPKLTDQQATETALEPAAESQNQSASLFGDGLLDPADLDPTRPIEVVFVDAGVDDADTLLSGLISGESDTQFVVVHLSADADGVSQITESLFYLNGVDAIHILSHGDGEGIQLGNTRLDMDAAAGRAGEIAAWGASLDADADLLIYGCDLASTADGRDLIDSISALCDCDVAASNDVTGHDELGGDWILEYTVGDVSTDVAFSYVAQASWRGTLDDTGYKSPTATGDDHNDFSNPEGAFASDDVRASETTNGDAQDYYDFDFGVPTNATIDGIEFLFEGYRESFGPIPIIELSWDGGATYTTTDKIASLSQSGSGTDGINSPSGGPTDLWGRAWTAAELSNENFRARIHKPASGSNFHIDHIQARVHYTEAPSISVDTTNDVVDGTTTDVATLLDNQGADGFISLREAIEAVNNDSGSDWTINLGAGTFSLDETGAFNASALTGDFDISNSITIVGAGTGQTIIDGSALGDRVFDVLSGGELTLSDLTIADASTMSIDGAAVNVQTGGALTATDVVFSNNDSTGNGGAIWTEGTTTLDRVAIFDSQGQNGGALSIFGGTTSLSNVTISGNTAEFDGAGIFLGSGAITIDHSTIANNQTMGGGNGGGIRNNGGTVNIRNSIVADNTAQTSGDDVSGAIVSGGYNIIEDATGFTGSVGTDITGSDPGLAALAESNNTFVHAITPTSNAYNAATGSTETTDQRGITRDANPDIGAYEYIPPGIGDGLVAHYEFEDGSGTTAVDSTANGNDGTLTGAPAFGAGVVGDGLDFAIDSGGNSILTIADSSTLDFGSGDFTIAFWAYTPSGGSTSIIFSDGGSGNGQQLASLSDGRISWALADGTQSSNLSVSTTTDQWQHVTLTRSGTVLQSYIDGVASSSTPTSVGSVTRDVNMHVGAPHQFSPIEYDGQLDDLRFYDRALSSADAAALHALGTPPTTVAVDTTADYASGDANFDAEVVKSDQPVVVDFWAEWCMPCRMLAPTIDEVATAFDFGCELLVDGL